MTIRAIDSFPRVSPSRLFDPHDAVIYNSRGVAFDAQGEQDRALADFSQAIELDPEYAAAYYTRGTLYASRGDYDRAIADYDQAINYNSRFAAAYYSRGRAWGFEGNYQQALADLETFLQLSPRASNREQVEAIFGSLRSRTG